ncbi:MAG: DUF126 domain-containing protein [Pyrobaculum sp.]
MLNPIVKGSGRVRAQVVKFSTPLSFLGDLDPESGKLGGVDIVDKIVFLPFVKGSTVGPYVLWGAAKRGKAPLAIVVEKPDLMLITACVLANIPLFQGRVEEDCIYLDLGVGTYEKCR